MCIPLRMVKYALHDKRENEFDTELDEEDE